MTLSGCVDLSPIKTTTTTTPTTTVPTKDTTTVPNPKITYGSVTDIDGNVYKTITIGTQTWMAENLKVTHYRDGSAIPNVTSNTAWANLTSGAYCDFNNTPNNSNTYGSLYNWYATTDSHNIAPVGWHIPSDAEWTTFENYLIANGFNYDNSTSGSKNAMSIAASTNWTYYSGTGFPGNNMTQNNRSGFGALPAGFRHFADGGFNSLGNYAGWWSSTENSSNYAWYRAINGYSINLYRDCTTGKKTAGLTIRCIKDTVSTTSSIPTNGLVAYYPFSGNANDVSGNGNNGTVVGATLTTDRFGNANKAYSFNGSSNYISVQNSTSLQNISVYSISAWVKINNWYNNFFPIIQKSDKSNLYGIYSLYVQPNSVDGNIGVKSFGINYSNWTLGSWKHIVLVATNTTCSLYINGNLISNVNSANWPQSPLQNLPLIIGMDKPGAVEYANGTIDDIGFWNRALTQDDITALYNAK